MEDKEISKEWWPAKIEFVKALISVQSTIKPAKKDIENTFYKSKYADLSSVHEACSKALTDNGFAITQGGVRDGGNNYLRTILHHKSGYSEAYDFPLINDLSNPQKMGSSITYARRYGLAAMVGVITEDDDREAASKVVGRTERVAEESPIEKKIDSSARVSEAQGKRFYAIAKANGKDDESIRDYQGLTLGLDKGQQMLKKDYESAIAWASAEQVQE